MYDDGRGVAKDESKAVKWWEAASAQGNREAQFNLGTALDHPYCLYRDLHMIRALVIGIAGLMYADGRGVAKDELKAAKLLEAASGQGLAEAQFNLGSTALNPSIPSC